MKIAVYGTGNVGEYVWRMSQKRKLPPVEIVYFVRSDKDRDSFHGIQLRAMGDISCEDFDYLVIASDRYAGEMMARLEAAQNGCERYRDKVIRYQELFPSLREGDHGRQPYQSYRVSGDLVFLAEAEDEVIPHAMYYSGNTYSAENIDAFFALTETYYGRGAGSPESAGYFLDIGANIGTTSVYVEKRISQSLKIIGFEPGQSNYDLFRANCLLNHTKHIRVEHFGLSDRDERKRFCYVNNNSGASSVVDADEAESGGEAAEVRRLDGYLSGRRISPGEVKYIWMDAEGYESKIIAGAMETLRAAKIPLLQEFNPGAYAGQNMLETYYRNIREIYGHFISLADRRARIETVYPISKLPDYAESMREAHEDLFLF